MRNSFTKFAGISLLAALLLFSHITYATTYYSRTNGGNWNVNTTWSTVTYGNATNTGTYPKAGDIANIGNGYTIYINASVGCATINIGQGASGILEYRNTASYVLTVTGNIVLNNGAKFWYNSNSSITHNLLLGGNFTNFGTVDFYFDANDVVNITFNQNTNSTVSGTGSWDLNSVTLTKTTSTATMLDVQTINFENGLRTLSATYGTYNHNNSGTYNINSAVPASFTIGTNVIFKVPQGTLGFATGSNALTLQGQLFVNGGTCVVGSAAGLQGIFSDQNGASVPTLNVSAGTLTVYGGITYGAASAAEPFIFSMTGGNILLNSGTTGTPREVFYITDLAASKFTMSAGTITLQSPNTAGAAVTDFSICGTNGTVTNTGGTVQFGNASTAAGKIFNFKPFPNAVYPNFKITGAAGTAFSLATSTGSTANFKLNSLYIDVNKTFDIRAISGVPGDNKTMTLTGTWNGVQAYVNNGTFTARTSTVQFNPTGAQSIGGTVTTNFYNLTINNSNNITLNRSANVTNILSMVVGKLYTTAANILTLTSTASTNIGSSVAFVDGPMVGTVAAIAPKTLIYPMGKAGLYRPVVLTVQHSTAASVTYKAEVFNNSAMALPYTLPASISQVSTVRYVQFTRQNVANFSNGKIQMYYGTDDGVNDYTTLLVAHDNGVNLWQNFAGVATANNVGNIVSSTWVGAFHTYFALGNPPGGNNALPISLLSFNAAPEADHVKVSWQTALEINNHFFTVEHSKDNVHFYEFANVDGAGNSTEILSYSVNDFEPGSVHYYRLKQTDFNGDFTYSKSIMVRTGLKVPITVSPNPVTNGFTHINFTPISNGDVHVLVSNILGKKILETTYPATGFGTYDINLDLSNVTDNGIYMLSVSCGDQTETQRLLVTGK